MDIVFYEKPGCINNTKQKRLLEKAGHRLICKDLLNTQWSSETLMPYLRGLPVPGWFNRSAPQIKNAEIIPEQLDEETALRLLIESPILIRRPLMSVGNEYRVGFDQDAVDEWVGLSERTDEGQDLEACPREHEV